MTELDVRDALERASGHLEPPPDLLERVREGGQRRVIRRRALLGVSLVAAAAGSVAGLRRLPAGRRRTGGDLAGDGDYIRRVLDVWRTRFGQVGEPHVNWAGNTPAGPVAIVVQTGPSLTGFVHGGSAVTGSAFLAGPHRTVLVVADDGRPMSFSPSVGWSKDGRAVRSFRPLTFVDGASVTTVPAQDKRFTIGLRSGDEPVGLANMIDWPLKPVLRRKLAGATDEGWDVADLDGFADRYGYPTPPAVSEWRICGVTPDGRPFVVQTLVVDRAVRTFVLLEPDKPRCMSVTEAVPGALASVRAALPGNGGSVIGEEGVNLSVGDISGARRVTGDVALLPPGLADVRVIRKDISVTPPRPD